MSPAIVIAAAAVLALVLLGLLFKLLYRVPAADQALIITGAGVKAAAGTEGRTYKIVTGGGALVIPVMQKAQYLSMRADKAILDVEGVDAQKIPVGVRGVAIFKVGDDQHSITNAATRFLHDQSVERGASSQMHDLVREVFHGHLRSIIGGLSVEDLIANRNELAQQTRDASADEMQKLGLVVDSLQIQEIIDPTGYIRALGEPRAAEVKKNARIAQAAADREATEREQEAARLKAAAERDTAIKLAEFQAERDRASALSAQSGPLADAEARKEVVVQETAVADLVAQREEKRLESTVRKPADAEAYRQRVEAEGQREARIALAEAAKRETELKAEADARRVELSAAADAKRVELTAAAQAKQTREVGDAEASATQAKGEAEGASVRARGLAEAEAIAKRAEALERQSDAVIGQQLAEQMPEIVRAAATAFAGVDNLTVLNGAQGIGELMNQVIGQAGPALDLARDTIGAGRRERRNGGSSGNGAAPPAPPA
ncbi:MAG TPA: SPFH domain-containing protein [Solirubrobacteraceae bacterium]